MSDQTQIGMTETIELPLDQIKPYDNNPRRITSQAIEAVAFSIEKYGYRQPIVVDPDHVIIVGHTRLLALQKLGWTSASVIVANLTPEQAREYRLVDNRTGEMTSWDHNSLVLELREFESGMLDDFFPEIDLQISSSSATQVTDEDLADAAERIQQVAEVNAMTAHTTDVECGACGGTFEVRTKQLPNLTWEDLESLVNGGGE